MKEKIESDEHDAPIKATLEFKLPEAHIELMLAANAGAVAGVVRDMDNQLRNLLKYGHAFKTADEALQSVRDFLTETIDNSGARDAIDGY
jgi:hypothetical protein